MRSLGMFWFTTRFTSGMSRPMLATSLATNTLVWPLLNMTRLATLSFYCLMLCRVEVGMLTFECRIPVNAVYGRS